MRILVVDNYDSFVYNLVQYLGQLDQEVTVLRNDDPAFGDWESDPAAVDTVLAAYDGVLVSPGPGTPQRAGASMEIIRRAAKTETPLLGVCLGHQAIGAVYGGTVERAPELMHGKTSEVSHCDSGVLAGLPDPFTATRYHSLSIRPDTLPAVLEILGQTDSGIIMAVRHRELPIQGVQFHPESVLTEGGHRMLANWLADCGQAPPEALVARLESEMAAGLASPG